MSVLKRWNGVTYEEVGLTSDSISSTEKGAINGVATLGADGKLVPAQSGTNVVLTDSADQLITTRKIFQGSDRSGNPADGKYRLEIGGALPGIAMNTYVTINGAIGTPVPATIAGLSSWMLGISSDVGANPVILVKGQTGPAFVVYAADNTERVRVETAGQIQLRGGLSATPAYSFLDDPDTGVDRPSANILTFYAGGVETGRFSSTLFSVNDGINATLGGIVTIKNFVHLTGTGGNAFIAIASTALIGNASAGLCNLAVRTVGGKVQFYAIFPTGAAIPIATEV